MRPSEPMRRTLQAVVLIALFLACGTKHTPDPYVAPSSYAAMGPDAKMVFLPAHVRIEQNGEPVEGEEGDRARLDLRGALERALALEHLHQRYVFASGDTADQASAQVDALMGRVEVCAEAGDTPLPALPAVQQTAAAVEGSAVVFIDARLHLTTKQRKAGQIAAATFMSAVAVAVVAVAVLAIAEGGGDGGGGGGNGCDAGTTAHVAVDVTDAVAQAALTDIDAEYLAAVCSDPLEPVENDSHGFWTGNHLDLAVAVMSAHGGLLWYRSGKIPLDVKKQDKAARNLRKFMQGMP